MTFVPRQLNSRLVLLVCVTLLASGALSGWVTARNQSGILVASMRDASSIMARNFAESGAYYLVLNDYAGLEHFLLKSAELPDIMALQVCEPNGALIVDIERSPGVRPVARSTMSRITPPPSGSTEISVEDERMILWQPIEAGKALGWLKATYSMSSIRQSQAQTLKNSLFLALFWVVGSSIALLLVMRPAVRSFSELTAFARKLDGHKGAEISVKTRIGEIAEFVTSLNYASKSLHASEQQLVRDRERLRKSEEKYRQLLDTVQEGIWVIDKESVTTFVNPHMAEILGYAPAEMIGKHLFTFMDEQGKIVAERNVERRKQGIKERHDFEFIRKDGGRIYARLETGPLLDEAGQYTGAIAAVADITATRRMENDRQANLKFFESMDRVNRAIQGARDVDSMMGDVLDVVLTIIDCDRAFLMYPCDPEAASWNVPMERTKPEYPGAGALNADAAMPSDMALNLREALGSTGPVTYAVGTERPVNKLSAEQFGVKSMMMAALYPKTSKPWAFGLHQCSYPRIWTPEEGRLFQEIGRRLADGLTGLLAYRDLQESENRYRRITEGLTDYQYSVRVENGCPAGTTHSPTCAIVTGYTAQEYAADPYLWIRMVAPEDREQVRERIQQILAGKESPPLDHRITRKDGAVRWVCDTIILLRDAAGQLLSYDGVIKDITERKWAEAELDRVNRRNRLILESAGEGIFGLDSEGKVTFANPVAAVMLGYDQQELIGISSHELIHSHHANGTPNPEGDCPICRAYRDGAIHRATKSVFWRKNGTAFPVECTSTPIIENDTLIGAVATFRDVTEKEEMEKRLGQAQKMEAIGTLAGGIAHDFNNILTPIIIHAEMALEDIPAKKTALRFSLEEVLKAAERARDLVQQILAFSRQTEGKQVVLNVEPIVKEALKLLRASVPATVEIRSHIKAEPWSILADPTQIHQILMNLCTNAAHAMREKGGVLKIDLTNESLDAEAAAGIPGLASGSYLMLSVGDTGHGMTPETMGRIYDPYFTTKAKGEGTGLGLAVVHGIAASLGGAITVESEPGKGSRFRVYFPMVDRKPLPAVQSTGSLPRGTEHILLVDDEQSMVDAMQPMLEHLGYRVTAGISSVEALEVFRADQSSFDLFLTDQTMPTLTGIDLARKVLKIKPGIPILLCSGFSDLVDEEKATAAGIRGYIMKPILMREMAAMIRRVLDNG